MNKSVARTKYLKKSIGSLLESEDYERIAIECRKCKMPSAYAIETVTLIVTYSMMNSRL